MPSWCWCSPILGPRPPPFWSSVCVHNNTRNHMNQRSAKIKKRKAGSIHHVNDIRWTWGGGGGPQLPNQRTGPSVRVLCSVFGLQTLAWRKLLVLTGKKLTFKFSTYIFEYRPLPPTSTLVSTYVMNAPRPSRFLPVFHVLLWMETEGKNGGGLGTRLNIIPLAVFFASLHIACSSNFSVCTTELLYNTYICRSVIKWISP